MKKNNTLVAIFLFLLFLNSCGTVAEGLGGSKKKGSEEFLVEKKSSFSITTQLWRVARTRNENR